MAVGPFLTHDTGYREQIAGIRDYLGSGVYAILVATTHTPNRATDSAYSAVSANEATGSDYARQALASKTVAVEATRVRFNCGKITFTASGDVTGRYLYVLYGTAASPQAADVVLGHIDLTGAGNASSIGAEFSFTPNAAGLFEVARSAAP